MFDSAQDPSTMEDRIDAFDLLYDEACGLCRAAARAAVRVAPRGSLRATGLRTSRAADLLPGVAEDERLRSFHLAAPTGRTWSGGEAVPRTLGLVPVLRPVADAIRRSAVLRRATDRTYAWVTDHRPQISRWLPSTWKRPLSARESGPPPPRDEAGRQPRRRHAGPSSSEASTYDLPGSDGREV